MFRTLHLMFEEEYIELREAVDDVATADLATQRITIHEETAWMLRSMAA